MHEKEYILDPKSAYNLVDFICGESSEASKIMQKYSPDQVISRPFRIASLTYLELLRSNKDLQETIFIENCPVQLEDIKNWIEMLSVIPTDSPFHPYIPKETFPFFNQRIKNTDTYPLNILDRAKILVWVNNYEGKSGNSGFFLSPEYRNLSIADRLNDPFAIKRWNLQISAYLDLAENDLRSALQQYNRVYVEKQPFDGLLTGLIIHQVIAQEQGRELTADEEQKIIRESLEYQVEYATELKTSFENNRNGLKRFEDKVWDILSKQFLNQL